MKAVEVVAVGVLTLVALLGIIVLTLAGQPVPDVLPFVVTAGLGVLGGAAVPAARARQDPGA